MAKENIKIFCFRDDCRRIDCRVLNERFLCDAAHRVTVEISTPNSSLAPDDRWRLLVGWNNSP